MGFLKAKNMQEGDLRSGSRHTRFPMLSASTLGAMNPAAILHTYELGCLGILGEHLNFELHAYYCYF